MQAATQPFSISTTQATPLAATAYVFFPLNMIAPEIRATIAAWADGGLLRPELATLRHCNGYIRQCEITELRQHMVAQAARNVYPAARRYLAPGYVITENGESKYIDGRNQGSDESSLLFTPWYPGQELPAVLGYNDGLVQFREIASSAQMEEAQYFLFPNWDAIKSGRESLPTRLNEIREHLQSRIAIASNDMLPIVREAIRACDLAETFGRAHVNQANAMQAEAKVKGWAWSYGSDALLYMDQLGIQRQDNLAQEQSNSIDRLAGLVADIVSSRTPVVEAPPTVVVPQPEEGEPAVATSSTAIEVGLPARAGDKIGEIVFIDKKKKTVKIETPTGEVFEAKIADIEV